MPTLEEIKKQTDQYISEGPRNYQIDAADELIDEGEGRQIVIDESVDVQESAAPAANQGLQNLLNRAKGRRDEGRFGTDLVRGFDTIAKGILGKKSDPNAFKYDKGAEEDYQYYRDLLDKHKSKQTAETARQKKRTEDLVDFEKKEGIKGKNKTKTRAFKTEQASNLVDKVTGEPVVWDPNLQKYLNANTNKPASGVKQAPLRTSPEKREQIDIAKVKDRTKRVDNFRKQPDIKKLIEQFDASQDAMSLLKSKNPIGDKLVKDMIIKSLGDSRISDKDVGRLGGSPALKSRVKNMMSELFEGTMSEENRGYFVELLDVLRKSNRNKYNKKARVFAKRSSNTPGKKKLYGSETEIYDNATLGINLEEKPLKEEKEEVTFGGKVEPAVKKPTVNKKTQQALDWVNDPNNSSHPNYTKIKEQLQKKGLL